MKDIDKKIIQEYENISQKFDVFTYNPIDFYNELVNFKIILEKLDLYNEEFNIFHENFYQKFYKMSYYDYFKTISDISYKMNDIHYKLTEEELKFMFIYRKFNPLIPL